MGRQNIIQPGLYPGIPGVRSLRMSHAAIPRPKGGRWPNRSVRFVCNGGKESLGAGAAPSRDLLRPPGAPRHNRAGVDILLLARRGPSGVVVDLVARKPSLGKPVAAFITAFFGSSRFSNVAPRFMAQ